VWGRESLHWCLEVWDCVDLIKLVPQLLPDAMFTERVTQVMAKLELIHHILVGETVVLLLGVSLVTILTN